MRSSLNARAFYQGLAAFATSGLARPAAGRLVFNRAFSAQEAEMSQLTNERVAWFNGDALVG